MRSRRLGLALVAAWLIAVPAWAKPPVWVAHGPHATVVLFGSVHILPGALADYLAGLAGGLKAVLEAERALRRTGSATKVHRPSRREAVAVRLRELPTQPLAALAPAGEEFTLVLARALAYILVNGGDGLKRIAQAEGVYSDSRFRDEIAKLEVDVVTLEMMVLRVLAAEKSGKQSLDIAGLLKIRGSEIQQRYSELMMLAAGPFALPLIREAMEAGWQGDAVANPQGHEFPGGEAACAPLASSYFNMRKTTIYGGSNEVQRNIVAQTVLG